MVQPRPVRNDDDLPEPPQVRRLRLLVSLLMVVLIGGMLVVVVAMVVKLGAVGPSSPSLAPVTAEGIALPAGEDVVAVGQGGNGVMLVTRDASGAEMLRVFDPASGAEVSATAITRE